MPEQFCPTFIKALFTFKVLGGIITAFTDENLRRSLITTKAKVLNTCQKENIFVNKSIKKREVIAVIIICL